MEICKKGWLGFAERSPTRAKAKKENLMKFYRNVDCCINWFVGKSVIFSQFAGLLSFTVWLVIQKTLLVKLPDPGRVIWLATVGLPLMLLIISMVMYINVRDEILHGERNFSNIQILVDRHWRDSDRTVRRRCLVFAIFNTLMTFFAGINTANFLSLIH